MGKVKKKGEEEEESNVLGKKEAAEREGSLF